MATNLLFCFVAMDVSSDFDQFSVCLNCGRAVSGYDSSLLFCSHERFMHCVISPPCSSYRRAFSDHTNDARIVCVLFCFTLHCCSMFLPSVQYFELFLFLFCLLLYFVVVHLGIKYSKKISFPRCFCYCMFRFVQFCLTSRLEVSWRGKR